ncbi:hypothetical protein BJY00DRAFT_83198 [Aspergillus carlsbadensis]|nr:hypothetical protein BJY00DRAFT_83198 [Aspergillus carlsbadensis]
MARMFNHGFVESKPCNQPSGMWLQGCSQSPCNFIYSIFPSSLLPGYSQDIDQWLNCVLRSQYVQNQ